MKSFRNGWIILPALILFIASASADEPVTYREYGQFLLRTDPENVFLPVSLRLRTHQDLELLDASRGLNLSFDDRMYRSKFYREENANIWQRQADPRFVHDAAEISPPEQIEEDGFSGESVSYESSYAKITRKLLFHDAEPSIRVVYDLTMSKPVVIHMPGAFGVNMLFGEQFEIREIVDQRAPDGEPLRSSGRSRSFSLLNAGPAAFSTEDGKFCLLVSHSLSGDIESPVPYRLVQFTEGQSLRISINIEMFSADRPQMLERMRKHYAELDAGTLAARLHATGHHVLYVEESLEEGESILLKAAEHAPDWFRPHMVIAFNRGRNRETGVLRGTTDMQHFMEAAYRMPWAYEPIMRAGALGGAGGFMIDERLSEEEKRLLLFNLMSSMENIAFYPDYFIRQARAFEDMKMYAHACAVLRQGLWAVDHWPVVEEKRENLRGRIKERIAGLEEKLLTEITAEPPAPIEVRPTLE